MRTTRHVVIACFATVILAGCASSHDPRAATPAPADRSAAHSHSLVTLTIHPDDPSGSPAKPTRSTIPVSSCTHISHRALKVGSFTPSTGTCVNVGATVELNFACADGSRWTLPMVSRKHVLHKIRVTRTRCGGVQALFRATNAGHTHITAQEGPPSGYGAHGAPASVWTLSLLVDA